MLALTERRSLQLIRDKEFRLASANKTTPKGPSAKKQQQRKPQVKAALDAYDRLQAAGKQPTQEAIKRDW